MFFTDYGQIPKVERCDMDGQNRTKLVDSKIVFPHGITLDLVSRLVYWADAYLDYIEVVDYEGKNRHTIIQGLLVRGNRGSFSRRCTVCLFLIQIGISDQIFFFSYSKVYTVQAICTATCVHNTC